MTLPRSGTLVAYPTGALDGESVVRHVEALPDGRAAVLTDETPVHPVDARWPDQSADRAEFVLGGDGSRRIPIVDAIVGATDGASLFVGDDVPVRPGAEGWASVVVHVVDAADAGALQEGDAVGFQVDPELRAALSLGHTACHLASLALNLAVADRWSKQPRTDGLGTPDFDGLAIERSRILEGGSLDRYRLNKSLRRAGFQTEGLVDALAEIERRVEARLAIWVDAAAPIRIERAGDALADRREWVAELPEGTVRIPCGGTHVHSTAELAGLRVGFTLDDDAGTPVLVMSSSR
ncbi:metal-dependent hydrolase [Agromyces seonyuensis]|uniref:Metal-dependent hydrolase n=1 Tax=Agromyces seonyuensis TaxID=2662446 RepID=A0A6I4P0D7_9MICO|nr:metal-dependent hydrolase [Agromyces seonyuensis]MWB97469.1 metal-dependent hydrolase [Agromyces seonyuensis]